MFSIGTPVVLDGRTGVVMAVVRADDDPRKCVPVGYRFVRSGDIAERRSPSFLISVDASRDLQWSHGRSLAPLARGGSVYDDALAISDGTMSSLTGYRTASQIQTARHAFAQFVRGAEDSGMRYASWIDAWGRFVCGSSGDRLPAYDATDLMFLRVYPADTCPATGAMVLPNEAGWIATAEVPVSASDAASCGLFGDPRWIMMRVGYVRRHLVVGKQRDLLDSQLALVLRACSTKQLADAGPDQCV